MTSKHISLLVVSALLAAHASFFVRAFHLSGCPSLRIVTQRKFRHVKVFQRFGSLKDSFNEVLDEFQSRSVSDIQKTLVRKGIDFKNMQEGELKGGSVRQETSQIVTSQSPLEKVPGCVANVQIRTKLIFSNEDNGKDQKIQFQGTADAFLSRGMLALLTTVLSAADNLDEVLAIDPYSIADNLGIRRALSPGRNDGLANMMRVIQHQIRQLLDCGHYESDVPLFIDDSANDSLQKQNRAQQSPCVFSSADKSGLSAVGSKPRPRVALLLSGGVDSSVALRLLLQQNYDVTAFYLKIWLEDELAHLGQCPWEDDYNVCRAVCEQAQVPLETLNLQDEYKDRVISYTIHEAQRGRTPNPDILCNSRIKFGCFYNAIAAREFDYVASGHYARLESDAVETVENADYDSEIPLNLKRRLFRAPDPVKDQSYFLCALTQDQLKHVIFPIGHLEKAQVRALADEFELPNRHRADSQGLCFLGKLKFEEFLAAYLGERPGDIVDAATGDILGKHRGLWYHTVGQRKGIGKVLDPVATSRGPWYVVAKDPDRNLVFCSNQYDEDIFSAARSEVHVEEIKWIAGSPPPGIEGNESGGALEMKIRHGPKLVAGSLTLADRESGIVKLDQKDGGLAPGQFIVFYSGEECLGGGVISERHWAKFLEGEHMSSFSSPFQRNNSAVAIP